MTRDEDVVLVLTQEFDSTADFLIEELDRRGSSLLRLDTGDFLHRWNIFALDGPTGWVGGIFLPDREVSFVHIKSVWYRRPTIFTAPEDVPIGQRNFVIEESRAAVGGLLRSLDTRWIDRPDVIALASFKPMQLKVAKQCGLTIPETIITSSPVHAKTFAERSNGPIITKPLVSAWIAEGNGIYSSFYTSIVESADFDELERVRYAPALLQRFIPKSCEVRVIVIGSAMFAVEIRTEDPDAYIDWRTSYDKLDYAQRTLPSHVGNSVQELMRRLELNFGAIDFVVTPEDEYVFLEINPAGQWAWLEEAVGCPLRKTLADLLLYGEASPGLARLAR